MLIGAKTWNEFDSDKPGKSVSINPREVETVTVGTRHLNDGTTTVEISVVNMKRGDSLAINESVEALTARLNFGAGFTPS